MSAEYSGEQRKIEVECQQHASEIISVLRPVYQDPRIRFFIDFSGKIDEYTWIAMKYPDPERESYHISKISIGPLRVTTLALTADRFGVGVNKISSSITDVQEDGSPTVVEAALTSEDALFLEKLKPQIQHQIDFYPMSPGVFSAEISQN